MQTLTCKHCNQVFSPKRVNLKNPKKFCSPNCFNNSRMKRVISLCLQCGTKTYNPKFCSLSCAATHNNQRVGRNYNPFLDKTCITCGKKTRRTVYCSDECNPKRLTHLTPEEKKHRHSAMHREAWQRYQAKLKNQTPADVDKKALQEFYVNCPKGYEVDHIIPISKGGLHCLSNLQYLTISENRKKSNKIV